MTAMSTLRVPSGRNELSSYKDGCGSVGKCLSKTEVSFRLETRLNPGRKFEEAISEKEP
jgi:hypothetical protein